MANEKRLIYANDPLKQLSDYMEKLHCPDDYRDGLYRGMEIAESYIKNAPTVDAVVLPCKVGDTVWIVGDKFPAEIEEIRITNDGVFFVYVEYDRGYEETEVWDNGEFQTTDIGKTVFLTGEEAEAALAKMDGGN